ncbi:MAG: hypothetical protein R3C28_32165 [Pirellulaceae bacterium]
MKFLLLPQHTEAKRIVGGLGSRPSYYGHHRLVICAQIRERFTDKRDNLLIEARWFKGLPLWWLSQQLGMKEATARIKVFRAKRHVGGVEPR